MSRVRLMEDSELSATTLEQVKTMEAAGADSSTLRGLAHRQQLFDSYFSFYQPARKGDAVEAELIELVRLKVARLNDCFT